MTPWFQLAAAAAAVFTLLAAGEVRAQILDDAIRTPMWSPEENSGNPRQLGAHQWTSEPAVGPKTAEGISQSKRRSGNSVYAAENQRFAKSGTGYSRNLFDGPQFREL
jgi:hypothetical protein